MTTNSIDFRPTKRIKEERPICAPDEKSYEKSLSLVFSLITEPKDWNAVLRSSKLWYDLGKKHLDFSSYSHWALYQTCRHGTATAVEYVIDNHMFKSRPVEVDLCKRFPYPIYAGYNCTHGLEIFRVLCEKRPDFLSVLHETLSTRELPCLGRSLMLYEEMYKNILKE